MSAPRFQPSAKLSTPSPFGGGPSPFGDSPYGAYSPHGLSSRLASARTPHSARRTSRRAFGSSGAPGRPLTDPRRYTASLRPTARTPLSSSRPHSAARPIADAPLGGAMLGLAAEDELPPIHDLEDDADEALAGEDGATPFPAYADRAEAADHHHSPYHYTHTRSAFAADRASPSVRSTPRADASPSGGVFSSRSSSKANAHWVTVYGFPPEKRDYVLMLFNQCGDIVEYETDDKGNWIHVRYKDNLDCSAALSKSGQRFDDLMIGVVPRAMDERKAAQVSKRESFVSGGKSKARVLQQSQAAPQLSWWTKFLEYVFGL